VLEENTPILARLCASGGNLSAQDCIGVPLARADAMNRRSRGAICKASCISSNSGYSPLAALMLPAPVCRAWRLALHP